MLHICRMILTTLDQSAPQVKQPLANFESTLTHNAESVPTPTTTQSVQTPSVVSDFYLLLISYC